MDTELIYILCFNLIFFTLKAFIEVLKEEKYWKRVEDERDERFVMKMLKYGIDVNKYMDEDDIFDCWIE